jgi:hypothetical protein
MLIFNTSLPGPNIPKSSKLVTHTEDHLVVRILTYATNRITEALVERQLTHNFTFVHCFATLSIPVA